MKKAYRNKKTRELVLTNIGNTGTMASVQTNYRSDISMDVNDFLGTYEIISKESVEKYLRIMENYYPEFRKLYKCNIAEPDFSKYNMYGKDWMTKTLRAALGVTYKEYRWYRYVYEHVDVWEV